MSIPYDVFTGEFLEKISEYDLSQLASDIKTEVVDGYMKRALNAFRKNCKYDFFTTRDDDTREFDITVDDPDLEEIIDIVSEGMVVQWLKPYVYQQELLENLMNTRDYEQYSPAELLMRVGNAYNEAKSDYKQMIFNYSYNHGDLTDLHL